MSGPRPPVVRFRRRMRPDRRPDSLLRRLLRRPLARMCVGFLLVVVVAALVVPVLLPEIARQHTGDLAQVRQGPSRDHLLGTDGLGRDVLGRLVVGIRIALLGVVEALAVVLLIGVPVGTCAGYFGGGLDRVVSWIADMMFSMPNIIIILVVLAVFPQSLTAAMLTLGVLASPAVMRVTRSATLPLRNELYVQAAQVSGLSHAYILRKHILPRIAGPIVLQGSLIASAALLVQSGLSFLRLIVREPAPSLGGMVADGAKEIIRQSWLIWPPGAMLALIVLALGLLGDAVRDATTESWSGRRATQRKPSPSSGRARRGARATEGRASAEPATTVAALDRTPELLAITGLSVTLPTPAGHAEVLSDVSIAVGAGEIVGLVGESGCGKTMTALSILGLLPSGADVAAGEVRLQGTDLTELTERQLRQVRGSRIGYISQEPMIGLDPSFRVGWQIAEAVRRHEGLGRRAARARVIQLLESVRLPEPAATARKYPHELSGGMAQRVAVARALAGDPELLVADEPTTALDVTVQSGLIDLLRTLRQERGLGILLVTHDWGVVADICDRAVVMYAGHVVETADVEQLYHEPRHPYTQALLAANPVAAPRHSRVLPTIPGVVPSLDNRPTGCRFAPRCAYVTTECRAGEVPILAIEDGRRTRCLHHDVLASKDQQEVPAR